MSSNKSMLFGVAAVVAGLSLAAAACGKNENKTEPKTKNETKSETTSAAKTAANKTVKKKAPVDVAPKPGTDYIVVEANHTKKKPKDPVIVNFKSFKVTRADFDPNKLEGGTAQIQIDIGSLQSGIAKRDGHLKSGDYLGAAKFGTATITIKDVKKAGGDKYKASAEIDLHGIKLTQPVEFTVLERMADGIRIKAHHELGRTAFKIGKPAADGDPVADTVVVKLELTLKKTS